MTSYEDVVWLTRHHELFSSAVFKNDPRAPYPAIDESDLGLYEYVRQYQADQFIQHDRPEHLEMRKVVHGYFTPKSMEAWRPFVQAAIKDLLDEAERAEVRLVDAQDRARGLADRGAGRGPDARAPQELGGLRHPPSSGV